MIGLCRHVEDSLAVPLASRSESLVLHWTAIGGVDCQVEWESGLDFAQEHSWSMTGRHETSSAATEKLRCGE